MTMLIPAAPETYMLEFTPETGAVTKDVVIGWQHVQGNMAFPLMSKNFGGMTNIRCILHPCGRITAPSLDTTFATRDLWVKFMKELDDEDLRDPEDEDDVPAVLMHLTNKTFKTNSYWVTTRGGNYGFMVPGGEALPDKRFAEKVTGAEFKQLDDVVTYMTVQGWNEDTPEEEKKHRRNRTPAEAPAEEDDLDDLI